MKTIGDIVLAVAQFAVIVLVVPFLVTVVAMLILGGGGEYAFLLALPIWGIATLTGLISYVLLLGYQKGGEDGAYGFRCAVGDP